MSCCIPFCRKLLEANDELVSERKYHCRWCSRKVSFKCNDEVTASSINTGLVLIAALFFFIWGASRAPVLCSIVGFCLTSMGVYLAVQTIRQFGEIEPDEQRLLTMESPLIV